MSLAVDLPSPFKGPLVKYLLPPPTLMWVNYAAPSLYSKALLMMLFIRDLNKSCEVEVYREEKSNAQIEAAPRTPM